MSMPRCGRGRKGRLTRQVGQSLAARPKGDAQKGFVKFDRCENWCEDALCQVLPLSYRAWPWPGLFFPGSPSSLPCARAASPRNPRHIKPMRTRRRVSRLKTPPRSSLPLRPPVPLPAHPASLPVSGRASPSRTPWRYWSSVHSSPGSEAMLASCRTYRPPPILCSPGMIMRLGKERRKLERFALPPPG